MSIFNDLKTYLSHVYKTLAGDVSHEVQSAETATLVFFKELLASFSAHGEQYVQVVKDAAKNAVAAAATAGGTNLQKGEAALAMIAATVAKEGFPIIQSDLIAAREAAYKAFQAANA